MKAPFICFQTRYVNVKDQKIQKQYLTIPLSSSNERYSTQHIECIQQIITSAPRNLETSLWGSQLPIFIKTWGCHNVARLYTLVTVQIKCTELVSFVMCLAALPKTGKSVAILHHRTHAVDTYETCAAPLIVDARVLEKIHMRDTPPCSHASSHRWPCPQTKRFRDTGFLQTQTCLLSASVQHEADHFLRARARGDISLETRMIARQRFQMCACCGPRVEIPFS